MKSLSFLRSGVTALMCMTLFTFTAQAQNAARRVPIWQNIPNAQALQTAAYAISSTRIEDPLFISHRLGVEDFVLTEDTRIDSIDFYSVDIGEPSLLGGDIYFYKAGADGGFVPGALLYAFPDLNVHRFPTSLQHSTYGQIFQTLAQLPEPVTLPAGHYYVGFRHVLELTQDLSKMGVLLLTHPTPTPEGAWSFFL